MQTYTSSHSTFSAIDTLRLITLHLPFFDEIDEKADFTVTEINHRFMTNRSHCNDLVSVLVVQFLSFVPECFETDPCLPLQARTLSVLPLADWANTRFWASTTLVLPLADWVTTSFWPSTTLVLPLADWVTTSFGLPLHFYCQK